MGDFISTHSINLSDMTLKEKIGQMFIARGEIGSDNVASLGVGGIFLDKCRTKEEYMKIIEECQNKSEIVLFTSTDMEGYWNPFLFYKSKSFGDISSAEEAARIGEEHAKMLTEIGFNLNFSPIVETRNKVWPGRSFKEPDIRQKIAAYIISMQNNGILATAKHFPGGNLIKNPHIFKVKAETDEKELRNFEVAINSNVSAVMIGHTIVSGELDSKEKQSTISEDVIAELKNKFGFEGLIITDEISMFGLKGSYFFRDRKMTEDVVLAGNDILLSIGYSFFKSDAKTVAKRIDYIADAVASGKISEERIDNSVKKILIAKGYSVID